ncbi:MAG: serine hydrolase domain-containing protein [Alphaproteobacteria bacterium]|jgi:CubicO group peptidase (beta-lactamase class C family)|nr:serine hydrolase domain-containing protein [Alphaproteobacteria bacterium]MDP6517445.1 serine hydrolase domain-containing protein [Alphaproteobacteria bacterium]
MALTDASVILEAEATPESAGFSAAGLAEIRRRLEVDVAGGKIPGAVWLVERRGRLACLEAIGYRNRAAATAMTTDSIFRIYSMTKPMTSIALMMLVESGRIGLDDPVADYLPEFGAPTVGVARAPCPTVMTVRHLMTHTAGLTYGVFDFSPVGPLYIKAGVHGRDQTLAEMCAKLGPLPLSSAPGSQWEYSVATDVVGRLVEVVSGQGFDRFLEARIFDPLGMVETGFFVPESEHGRMAESSGEKLIDRRRPAKMLSGGGGLVSTASDYLRFARAILAGGGGLVSPETLAEMARDQIGALAGTGPLYIPGGGYGFGLGFAVRTQEEGWAPGAIGDLSWGGYAGTYFWVDPLNDLIAMFLVQAPERREHYRALIRRLVYAALAE